MAILIGISIALISFFIQIRPRLKVRHFGVDGWRHLMVGDYIREHKSYPKWMDKFLIEAPSDYPPGLRYVLSLFGQEFIKKYEWLVSPVIDFLHNLLIFGFVYLLSGHLLLAVLAQIIYMSAPLTIMENSNLSTRSFASILFSLTFIGILLFSISGGWPLFVYSMIMVSILLLSHRMSVQTLFFTCVFFSLYEKDFSFIGIYLAGTLLAIIASRGFYLKILKGHIGMLEYWRQNIQFRYAHEIRGLPKKGQKSDDMVFNLYQKVRQAPFIAVLAANPAIVLVFIFFILRAAKGSVVYDGLPEILISKFIPWAIFLLVVGILIRSFKFLEHMGEGERYIEYAGLPIAVVGALTVYYLYSLYPITTFVLFGILILFAELIPAFYIQQRVIINDRERSVSPELWQIFKYIDSIETEVRLMCVPQLMSTSVMYFTKAKTLCTDNSIAHITDLADVLPVIKKPLDEIFKKYNINYLLLNEHYAKLAELKLKDKNIVKQSGDFVLLKVQ